jgi:acetyltransferase
MSPSTNLTPLFEPAEVAVVGASAVKGKIGHTIVENLVTNGYRGKIFPVNPKADDICGLKVVRGIQDLPSPLDLAVLCVPPPAVVPALNALAQLPVKAVAIITAGFKEVGGEGYRMEREIERIAREHSIALLGPNCLGLVNTARRLNATFAVGSPPRGSIGFFSQSGALCVGILDWSKELGIGFSKFVSMGNKAVLDECDLLEHLAADQDTNVILGYLESIEDGGRFLHVARRATREKPVILIKSGTTAAGAKAASSHTGALAGANEAYEAAFRQSGVLRVDDVATLFNLAQAFSCQPLPAGPNVAVVTNAGGLGILSADACSRAGLNLATPSAATLETLRGFLPGFAALYNPIDIIGDADAERYARTLDAVLADEQTHTALVVLAPTARVEVEKTSHAVIELSRRHEKPVFCCYMGGEHVAAGRELLREAGVPCYDFPEPAVACIQAMYAYSERASRPAPVAATRLRDRDAACAVVCRAREAGVSEIVEFQAQEILRAYNLPAPETRLARTSDEAARLAERIGFPVVLKIASPQISHKSDVGGVAVNLGDADAVRAAFARITSRAARLAKGAFISGCLVQAMAPRGAKEVIVGFRRDPQFGPLVLFGLGGIYVEVLKDISCRLAPLTLDDAREMIREVRSYPLLRGVRGEPPVDFAAIEEILMAMSRFAQDFPEVHEAEFNPVLAWDGGAVVADVRVVLARPDLNAAIEAAGQDE